MILSAISVLMCVATATLWVRSYFVTDRWFRSTDCSNGTFAGHIASSDFGGWHLQRCVVFGDDRDENQLIAARKHTLSVRYTSTPHAFNWDQAKQMLEFASYTTTLRPTDIV